jgi:hypothetical protein
MWIAAPAVWLTFAGYGYWIASLKRRPHAEGILFGLLLGPIGCVVEATRPERTVEEVEELRARSIEEAEAGAERERERLESARVEADERSKQARIRAEAMRLGRAEAYGRFSSWFDRAILRFGWFKALPEVIQPIVIGLCGALPIVAVMIYLLGGTSR